MNFFFKSPTNQSIISNSSGLSGNSQYPTIFGDIIYVLENKMLNFMITTFEKWQRVEKTAIGIKLKYLSCLNIHTFSDLKITNCWCGFLAIFLKMFIPQNLQPQGTNRQKFLLYVLATKLQKKLNWFHFWKHV